MEVFCKLMHGPNDEDLMVAISQTWGNGRRFLDPLAIFQTWDDGRSSCGLVAIFHTWGGGRSFLGGLVAIFQTWGDGKSSLEAIFHTWGDGKNHALEGTLEEVEVVVSGMEGTLGKEEEV